jgi:hypothetical protein
MTKKEYVLKVLEKVKEYRDKAEMIKTYLMTHDDEEYVNYMYDKCVNAVEVAVKTKDANKVQKLGKLLDEIHQKEAVSKKADEEDINKLDELLSSL